VICSRQDYGGRQEEQNWGSGIRWKNKQAEATEQEDLESRCRQVQQEMFDLLVLDA